jgi:EmrB/QacA subfamily drug resistance transporter
VFLIGVGVFTVASLLCGAVWTAENLVAGRILQGLGAAMLIPTSLALIPVCFSPHERGRALGIWAGASAIGAALGPVLGGWLTDAVSWRAIFLINAPVALAAVILTLIAIPESRDREAGPPDWLGAGLAATALALMGWGLSGAVEWGLASLSFWAVMAGAGAATAAFIAVERRARHPMLPLGLFRFRVFTGVNLMTFALYFALSGVLYLLPYEWMRVDGVSAAQVGAGLLPFAAIMGLGSPMVGRLADRFGPRPFLIAGPAIAAAGFALMILPEVGADYWTRWLPAMMTLAVGMTITVAPLTAALFASVDPDRTGLASGVNNAAARVGGMVAVAVMTLVVSLAFAWSVDGSLASSAGRLAAVMGGGGFEGAVSAAEKDAFRLGFQICMGIAAVFGLASSAIAVATTPKGRAGAA